MIFLAINEYPKKKKKKRGLTNFQVSANQHKFIFKNIMLWKCQLATLTLWDLTPCHIDWGKCS